MTDISNELLMQDYTNVLPNNYFYIWINKTSGMNGEMSFCTSTANFNISPFNPTGTDPWKNLVADLSWNDDGVSSTVTNVTGSSGLATQNPPNDFGDGDGGISGGYDSPDVGNYNVGVSTGPSSNGSWSQDGGVTTVVGNANPSGGAWPFVPPGEAKRYKVTLLATGGFDFTEELSICFHGDSKILVLNKQTGKSEEKKARDVADTDFVYSTTRNKFVPVVFNSVTLRNKSYMLLEKDLLGPNKPSEDFYITKGHPILYEGKETPVEKIPGAKEVTCEEQEVYSIVTDIREYIIVNGVETMTWSYHGWRNAYLNGSHKISWTNGTKQHQLEKIDVAMVGNENVEPKNIKVCKNAFGNNIPNEDMMVNENYELIIDDMTTKTKIREMVNGATVILLE